MLGNFSFGDYFKEEAIPWAWELLTEVLGLDATASGSPCTTATTRPGSSGWKRSGWAPDADPAHGRRGQLLDHGRHRPLRPVLGDLLRPGEDFGRRRRPTAATDRYVEIWNLVFSSSTASSGALSELPRKNIDTGAGLERMLPVLQGELDRSRPTCSYPSSRRRPSVIGTGYGRDRATDWRCASWPTTAGP